MRTGLRVQEIHFRFLCSFGECCCLLGNQRNNMLRLVELDYTENLIYVGI